MRSDNLEITIKVKKMAEENLDVVGTFYGVDFQGVAAKPTLPTKCFGE